MFEVSLCTFLGCFGFIPRKFQSSFIKDSPNTINSMWLFFVLSHFSHIFSPFEMLFCIVHECEWLFHLITLFFNESLKMPDFLSLITTEQVFQKFCFGMNISLTEFYNSSFNWLPFQMAIGAHCTLFSRSGYFMAFL